MMNKLLIFLLVVIATTLGVGCSSNSAKDEGDVALADDENFAEEGEEDFADVDDSESGDSESDELADDSDSDSFEDGDEFADASDEDSDEPAEGGSDEVAGSDSDDLDGFDDEGGDEIALDDGEAGEEDEFPEDVAVADSSPGFTEPPQASDTGSDPLFGEAPSYDELDSGDVADSYTAEPEPAESVADSSSSEPTDSFAAASSFEPAATNTWVPVKKIQDMPFERGGALLNRVYIARPGDTLSSISEKIYGSNRSSDLQTWNPNFKGKGVKTGDKVYYNSPRDPADSSRMLTYYEDMGVPAATYATRDGENIRVVSKTLLGSSDSWKEVWATNLMVESKGDLPAGTELRYWPEGSDAGMAPIASNTNEQPPMDSMAAGGLPPADDLGLGAAPPPVDPAFQPPSDMASSDPMAPPADLPMDPGLGDIPPPPPVAGGLEPPAPPPPPPADFQPPAAPAVTKKTFADDMASDPDTTMALAVGALLILAAAFLFVVIRKNRAKRVDLGQTQV